MMPPVKRFKTAKLLGWIITRTVTVENGGSGTAGRFVFPRPMTDRPAGFQLV